MQEFAPTMDERHFYFYLIPYTVFLVFRRKKLYKLYSYKFLYREMYSIIAIDFMKKTDVV